MQAAKAKTNPEGCQDELTAPVLLLIVFPGHTNPSDSREHSKGMATSIPSSGV